MGLCPGQCGSVCWNIVCVPKGCGTDSQTGPMPSLWSNPWLGSLQEETDRCFSLTSMFLSFSFFLSLSLYPLSKKAMKKCSQVRIKNKERKKEMGSWIHAAPKALHRCDWEEIHSLKNKEWMDWPIIKLIGIEKVFILPSQEEMLYISILFSFYFSIFSNETSC